MTEADLRKLQEAIFATDPQDVETIELLKTQYARARESVEAAEPRPAAPAGAAGAPAGSGNSGRIPNVRAVAAVGAMAPARMIGGMLDLGGEGVRTIAKASRLPDPKFPHLVPQVDRLTDVLAGEPVGPSIGRAAFEGAITGPLMAGKTANVIPQAVAGAAGGGASEAVREAGGAGWAQLLAALVAGQVGGRMAKNAGLSPSEVMAKGPLRRATEGLSPDDFATAKRADAQMRAEGITPLPSQAMQVEAPGLQALQGAMKNSRASLADDFRISTAQAPKQTQVLIERLKSMGGQTPRPDDDMAASIQRLMDAEAAKAPKAINQATKPLYNDPLGKAWTLKPEVRDRIELGMDQAIYENRGNQAVVQALTQARAHLLNATAIGETNPKLLAEALQSVKQNLTAYSEYPQAANYSRKVVSDTIKPLEALVAKHAPQLGAAPKVQAALREDLPTPFNEVLRQARTSTGTEAALAAVEKRPEVLRTLAKENPLLAQEVLQRQLDRAIEKVTTPRGNLPRGGEGADLKNMLTRGDSGRVFNESLDILLPGRPEAQEGFRRILDVVANASKPTTLGGQAARGLGVPEEAVRGTLGTGAQQTGVFARVSGAVWGNFRDNATIRVLQDPKVIARLERIAALPTPRLTLSAVTAGVPQLFTEPQE